MSGRGDLTDAEREALVDWWDSDWPDDVDGVIGTLWDVVAGIVAGRLHGIRFRVEVACDGYAALTADDLPDPWIEDDDYFAGSRNAAEGIRSALHGPAESPGHTETGSGSQGARGAVEGAEWLCLHCGDDHETHEGDCCCHGHDEDSE